MGGIGSSSKRKASKKKSNKSSSQRRKKNRRKESKKRSRDYDSVSSYSDDDFSDSDTTSSPASESHSKRRKNKSKKIRRRDRFVSSESDTHSIGSESDSLFKYKNKNKKKRSKIHSKSKKRKGRDRSASPDRKRKRLTIDRRKKLKPSRKHSSSSDSPSCSTCPSSGSGDEDDHRRSKTKSNKETERPRGRALVKVHKKRKYRSPSCSSCSKDSYEVREKRKVRSPSCSSCSRGSERTPGVVQSEVASVPVNNSRRLKSVIAIAYQPLNEGENRWERDLNEEAIVYDLDDYRAPRSPDMNASGRKREFDSYSHDASNKKIHEEVTEGRDAVIDGSDKKIVGDNMLDGAHTNNHEGGRKTDVSAPDGDDLESILRRQALENLRKFKGGVQTGPRDNANLKTSEETDVGGLYSGNADISQNKSPAHDRSNNQEMSGPMVRGDFSRSTVPDDEKESEIAKEAVIHPPVRSEDEKSTSPRSVTATNSLSKSDGRPDQEATNACSSSVTEPLPDDSSMPGEHNAEEHQHEAKDGFEQKTMSVMRGGEMVQVSYKVYIPKRAPALARRPLKR